MSDLTWAAPANNWLGAVADPLAGTTNAGNTGLGAIISAWCGMGTDQTRKTLFMMGNGGHEDYFGNEVYSLDLRAATPSWSRLRNASAHDGSGSVSVFSDGRPSSDHSGMCHVEAGGRWFKAGMGGTNYYGYANSSQWWEFSLASNDYISHPGYAGNNGGTASCGAVYDAVNGQIIAIHSGNGSPSVEYVSLSNMAVASKNTNGLPTGGGILPAFDTTNRILLVKDDGNANFWWLPLSSPTAAWRSLTASGTAPGGTQAFAWHTPSNAFLTWDRAGGLLKLTPTVSSGGYTGLTWTAVAGNGGATPQWDHNLLYNKVSLINDMGNGQSALVVLARYGNPDTYILKIPARGV